MVARLQGVEAILQDTKLFLAGTNEAVLLSELRLCRSRAGTNLLLQLLDLLALSLDLSGLLFASFVLSGFSSTQAFLEVVQFIITLLNCSHLLTQASLLLANNVILLLHT